jgi:hypothetical protein
MAIFLKDEHSNTTELLGAVAERNPTRLLVQTLIFDGIPVKSFTRKNPSQTGKVAAGGNWP